MKTKVKNCDASIHLMSWLDVYHSRQLRVATSGACTRRKNRLALVLSISSCIIVSTSICVSYCYCQVSSGCLETTEGLLCGYTLKFIFKIVIIFSIETTGVDDKSNELIFHLFENVLVQYIDHKWIQSVINPQSAAINEFSLHEGGIIFYSVKDLKKVVT